jgi:ribonuclease P protein component
LVVYARPNGLNAHRFGVTTPKATGNAVIRNRFKRWCKEFYRRQDLSALSEAADFNVFVGNKRLKKDVFKDVEHRNFDEQLAQAFQQLLKRLG